MDPSLRRILVVGGSIAAVSAADTLRAEGYEGSVTVIGEEAHTAYARPPLSKTALMGDATADSVLLPALDGSIEVLTSARATALDLDSRTVTASIDGAPETFTYDGLLIATGARSRLLSGPETEGEHAIRTLDDAIALGRSLAVAQRVVILGGGFLGMELASTARSLGLRVTVVDVVTPLALHLGAALATLVVGAAKDNGVEVIVSPGGAWLHGEPTVRGVRLGDGSVLEADVVITAVGDVPNSEWLSSSGLASSGCLLAGADGAVRPGVVAAGDVVGCREMPSLRVSRSPHWHSAIAQGRAAARTLLGLPQSGRPDVPYVWTEGHGLEIKVVGRIPADRPVELLEGSLEERHAVLQWHVQGVPVAAASVNHRMPLAKLKRLAGGTPVVPPIHHAEVSA